MSEPTLEEVGRAVRELRETVESKAVDHAKVEKINTFLDTAEEKIFQPIVKAQQEAKLRETEIAELKTALEKTGASEAEVKKRIEDLEVELARAARSTEEKTFRDTPEYKAANEFCRHGFGVGEEHKQLLRTDDLEAGGILVPTEMDTMITKKITEIDPIRSVARVRTTSAKMLIMPIRKSIPVASFEGETEASGDSTSLYEATQITPYAQSFTVPVTLDMLQDAAFDMEAEIMSDATEAFAFGEGQAFVVGSGFKSPQGFTQHPTLQANARGSGVSGELTPDSLILLTGDLKVGYDPVYVMNRRTLATIRTFRADAVSAGDASGGFLWQPGLNGPVAPTINGFPYILANSMPDIASNAFAVAFGDFARGYTIIDRRGTMVIRDEFSRKRERIVEFTMNRWLTAQVTLPEALQLLQIDA